jgi:hypothetical protein
MLEFKHGLLAVRKETALDFHASMPSVSAASFERCIHLALPLLIGLWPLSHPAKLAAEVIGLPELAALRYRLQHDLEEGLLLLLRSLPSE